ncbi:hypothetical protein [Sorangium sp. So ce1182]|uniref:hypothetical protein n=1 Tax=Sorangium sp. So ce1182 TaxID=3133334 RepID=UPI003F601B55
MRIAAVRRPNDENSIQPMQLTMLMKSLRGFFAPIATGAKRAMGELGAAGRVTGNVLRPTEHSGDQQKDMELQTLQ